MKLTEFITEDHTIGPWWLMIGNISPEKISTIVTAIREEGIKIMRHDWNRSYDAAVLIVDGDLDDAVRAKRIANRYNGGKHISINRSRLMESTKEKVDYVIYVNDKPATVYDTKPQARADLDDVKRKHPTAKIVIKRRHRSEYIV